MDFVIDDALTAKLRTRWRGATVQFSVVYPGRFGEGTPLRVGPWSIDHTSVSDDDRSTINAILDRRTAYPRGLWDDIPLGTHEEASEIVDRLLVSPKETIAVPIYNLEVHDDIGGEVRILDVLFVSRDRLRGTANDVRLPLSIERCDQIVRGWDGGGEAFPASAYAVLHTRRHPCEDFHAAAERVAEASDLLASSFFMMVGRGDRAPFGGPDILGATVDELIYLRSANEAMGRSRFNRNTAPCILSRAWTEACDRWLFGEIRGLLHEKKVVHASWRKALKRAAILSGRSHLAKSPREAFLNDIMAVEVLLTRRGDPIRESLRKNVVALYGDPEIEPNQRLTQVVDRLYSIRCDMVHDGDDAALTLLELAQADNLLFNLLFYLPRLKTRIRQKSDVFALSSSRGVAGPTPLGRFLTPHGWNADRVRDLGRRRHWSETFARWTA